MSEPHTIIKRYANRKLYDTSLKCYIALDGIAASIRQGKAVQVIDDVTGEDITSLTLMQIIMEQEKRQAGFLPRAFLDGLIRAGGQTLTEMRQAITFPSMEIPVVLEQQISKFLKEHDIPTRNDLEALQDMLDELDQKISALRK
jgi:polyhydroxyalkanoate synthesis repressor PhaR